jgi:hypothetical protein
MNAKVAGGIAGSSAAGTTMMTAGAGDMIAAGTTMTMTGAAAAGDATEITTTTNICLEFKLQLASLSYQANSNVNSELKAPGLLP